MVINFYQVSDWSLIIKNKGMTVQLIPFGAEMVVGDPQNRPPVTPLTTQPPSTTRFPRGDGSKMADDGSFEGRQETKAKSVDYQFWLKTDPMVGDMADELAGGSSLRLS